MKFVSKFGQQFCGEGIQDQATASSGERAGIASTAFCKNTGHGASGRKKNCATTKNWPIGKIEYVATVDLINSCNIDRINTLLLHLALCKIISLNISEIAIEGLTP